MNDSRNDPLDGALRDEDRDYIGLAVEDAVKLADERGTELFEPGDPRDFSFQPDRLTITVTDGVVDGVVKRG